MHRPLSRGSWWVVLILVMVAGMAAHFRALQAPFLSDDIEIIQNNTRLLPQGTAGWERLLGGAYWSRPGADLLWRPLTLLSLATLKLAGTGAAGVHLVNLLLHALVAVLLTLLVARFSGPTLKAGLTGLLFGIHPLGCEAVTLGVGQADLLVAAAVMAALLLILKWRAADGGGLFLMGVALCSAAACLAKENGFVLTALAVASLLLYRRPRPDKPASLGRHGAWPAVAAALLPAVAVLMVRLLLLGRLMRPGLPPFANNPLAHAGFLAGHLEAVRLLGRALTLFLWPRPLSVDYSYAALTVPGLGLTSILPIAAGVLLLTGLAWRLRRRTLILYGLAFFFLAHGLTGNLLFPIGTIFAERLLYLPMAGLCMVAAELLAGGGGLEDGRELSRQGTRWLLWPAGRLRQVAGLLLLTGLAGLVVVTDGRQQAFTSQRKLWTATVAAVPGSAKAHYNLGNVLARSGTPAQALKEFRRSLAILPEQPYALNNLAIMHLRLGRPRKALQILKQAVALAPEQAPLLASQAMVLQHLGRLEAAREVRERARRLAPELFEQPGAGPRIPDGLVPPTGTIPPPGAADKDPGGKP